MINSVDATELDIFKAGFWYGMEILEKRLIDSGLVDAQRAEQIADVVAAEYEAIPETDKSLIVGAGVFTVEALRGKNPNGKEVTH